jgi:hypothetical protein
VGQNFAGAWHGDPLEARHDFITAVIVRESGRYAFAFSRRDPSEVGKGIVPHEKEGAGYAGRWMRPQPRVQNETKQTSIVTTVTPEGRNGSLRRSAP